MREYEMKKKINLENLEKIMKECFESVEREGNKLIASYKGIKNLKASIEGKKLVVEVETSMENPSDTIKAWNKFLEKATGYTPKQRKQRLMRKAKKGKL